MPRKCAIGTVKTSTASGRSCSTSRSRWRRQRGVTTFQIVSRVSRSRRASSGLVLGAPQVAVALEPREPVAQERVASRPPGRSGSVRSATRALDGPTAVRRHDQVGARPRTCPSRAATRRACSRSGSRGRPRRRRRGSSGARRARQCRDGRLRSSVTAAQYAPRAGEHGRDRLGDDRDVRPDRPVLDVGEVEPDEVVELEARAAGDLPEPGHARQHVVARAVPVLEHRVVAERKRPRADEAHLAPQHVHELGQLVDREPAQHAADAGDARIVPDLEQRARRPRSLARARPADRRRPRPSCGT